MKTLDLLLEKSIESELCCHCGACAGVCPVDAISCNNNILSVDVKKCVNCGMCIKCCPATGYQISDTTLQDIKSYNTYVASAASKNVHENASSGGFVTQALITMLSEGVITKAAVVVPGCSIDESHAKYVITSDVDIILSSRRSKYTQATIDNVLKYIKANDEKYAIVGLPCQLYAVTEAMKSSSVLNDRIICKLGLVCGYTYNEDCIDGLIKVMNLNKSEVSHINGWREGGLPGDFSLTLTDGTTKTLPFADEHSVDVTYYAQNRCKLCKDCLCEYGDLVSADIGGWRIKKTLVISRTSTGDKVLNILTDSDSIILDHCELPFEKTVIPFMLREKRSKVDMRLSRLKKNNGFYPRWIGGYVPSLMKADKIAAYLSLYIENYAVKNKKIHTCEKMLKLGHLAYHRISSAFILKVIFKIEQYLLKVCNVVRKLYKSIFNKFEFAVIKSFNKKVPNRLNAVIIGLGAWGGQYIKFLSKSKYYKLIAAYDKDEKKLSEYSKKYGFAKANSIEHLCEQFNADVIFILSPTNTHQEVYSLVYSYGKPVYVEKPISDTLSAGQKMYCLTSNNILYVAHSMKFEPCIQKINKIISTGKLGNIVKIELCRIVKSKRNSYFDGIQLFQIGVHLIDIVLFLLNKIDSVKSAKNTTYKNTCLDNVVLMSDNTICELKYGFGDLYNFSVRVCGTKGTLVYGDNSMRIYTDVGEEKINCPMINEKTVYRQLEELYYAIIQNKPYLNTAENAISIMEICDKIIKLEANHDF